MGGSGRFTDSSSSIRINQSQAAATNSSETGTTNTLEPGQVALVCEDCEDRIVRDQTDEMVWYCVKCGGRRQSRTVSYSAQEDN